MRSVRPWLLAMAMLGCGATPSQAPDAASPPPPTSPAKPDAPPAAPPSDTPASSPKAADTAAPAARAPFDTSDALLAALERSTDGLRDFQAKVVYDRKDALTGDRERRTGRLVLDQPANDATRRRIGIVFDQFIDAAGHGSPQVQRFAFGDGWLSEFDDARKQCIERQLVPDGKRLDPLRLGEGPMPLPVGQRAEDVRRQFTVSLVPEAERLKGLEGVQGLVLVPRKGSGVDEDFQEVRVWYDLGTFAPMGVVATMRSGDVKTVRLLQVRVNAGLDDEARKMLDRTPPAGWKRDVRPWRAPAP